MPENASSAVGVTESSESADIIDANTPDNCNSNVTSESTNISMQTLQTIAILILHRKESMQTLQIIVMISLNRTQIYKKREQN